MPRIQVETGALHTAGGTAAGAAEELNGLLGPFQNTCEQGADAIGQPEGADAMLVFGTRWWFHMLGLSTLLADTSAGLVASADVYQGTEQAVAGSFTPGG